MSETEIQNLRDRIDQLDNELRNLLNQRAKLVISLGRKKSGMRLNLYDPDRERRILDQVTQENPGPLSREAIVRLFERIIDESRFLERKEAYGGEKDEELP